MFGPDQDSNVYSCKNFSKKVNCRINQHMKKSMQNFQACEELMVNSNNIPTSISCFCRCLQHKIPYKSIQYPMNSFLNIRDPQALSLKHLWPLIFQSFMYSFKKLHDPCLIEHQYC